jgi:molecular chaperone GrpE
MTKKGPITKLKEELQAKEAEVAEIKTLTLRKAAEYDNARKRWQREREEVRIQAQIEILIDLVDIWDNFERALSVEMAGEQKEFDAYRKGVELIFSQFTDKVSQYGLSQYSCAGEIFDPAKAEVIGYYETDEYEHGKIIDEVKKGFMLGEKVIRPAQVIVAKEIKKEN